MTDWSSLSFLRCMRFDLSASLSKLRAHTPKAPRRPKPDTTHQWNGKQVHICLSAVIMATNWAKRRSCTENSARLWAS